MNTSHVNCSHEHTKVEELLETDRRTLAEARHLEDGGFYEGCVSRAYCAMFHAAEAALLSKGVPPKTHKGVHMKFGEHLVQTGAVPPAVGRNLTDAFRARQSADYKGTRQTAQDAADALREATELLETVGTYLRST